MIGKITATFRKWRYGEPIIIVSGLPRSGTSMMMKMLDATGIEVMTDRLREADIDNPNGYFEDERVKDLEQTDDKTWIRDARGKALKVISFLLKDLPPDNDYRVIFMRRNLDEILNSQNKMIDHRGSTDTTDDELMKEHYRNDIARARVLARHAPNFSMLEVHYATAIGDPEKAASQVNVFLQNRLDVDAMAAVVDPNLYRNRKTKAQ